MTDAFDRRSIPPAAHEGTWLAPDGYAIRRIDWPSPPGTGQAAPRGSLLFLPGRADFYEKYLETLAYWADEGWHVTAADWRGQAGSGRFTSDPLTGHVEDFSVWVEDLAALWRDWTETTPGPHVLVGHSMGGHLVLRTLAERKITPDAVVLSAPMLGFVTPIPAFVQHAVARLMCRIGDSRRMAWASSEKPGASLAGRAALLTHDVDRYADELWWKEHRPALAMGPASWGWVERAADSVARLSAPGVLEAIETPVLVLAARYDGLVAWKASERAARRLPRAQLAVWGREGRHELLREVDAVRDRVLATIDDFLDRMAPRLQG
ncbi:alpha/beta hydrolase [Novosphingobium sp. KCTC 2891]|uniref:alpha/beta fold hydrolase n=1 Tax=Novosphingobium sp. KCTC 2891 TaxID=2989730 RepID=UPI0022221A36|nr:alpha/beta hydrolase [Novosphingobium sp. KCTC 2891]MCW1381225.1 alpha/beta hydrolase [Novosphingobium sp. KCTC 2891]